MPMPDSQATEKNVPWDGAYEDGVQEEEFKPLAREQAQQWRAKQPVSSIWRLLGIQFLVGLAAGALGGLLTQSAPVAWSVLYGAASVLMPSALMAYGVTSRAWVYAGQAAFANFLFWHGVKILLVLVMLWLAPKVVPDLSWLGLLAGLVVALKVYWFGFWFQARRSNNNG